MNCHDCEELLQRRLDDARRGVRYSEPSGSVPGALELDRHLAECQACRRTHAAAGLLLEGLESLPDVSPPIDFAWQTTAAVLRDRMRRRQKMHRRVLVTAALAASILLMAWLGNAWLPQPKQEVQKANIANRGLPSPSSPHPADNAIRPGNGNDGPQANPDKSPSVEARSPDRVPELDKTPAQSPSLAFRVGGEHFAGLLEFAGRLSGSVARSGDRVSTEVATFLGSLADKLKPAEPIRPLVDEVCLTVLSFRDRLTGQTKDQALVLIAGATGEVPDLEAQMRHLVARPLEEPLDPTTESLRQAGHEVSQGFETVAGNARRAFDYFVKELPALDTDN